MPRAVARWIVLVLAVAGGVLSCIWPSQGSVPLGFIDPDRPECPHDWTRLLAPKEKKLPNGVTVGNMSFPNGFSVPGPQTNIPEFNDCQKFVLKDPVSGKLSYGPALLAVFASYRLDSLTLDTTSANVFAAAEVLNYSTSFTYAQLGIKPYFNCLYLFGAPGQLRARMIAVGANETQCQNSYSPTNTAGQELAVREIHVAGFKAGKDYPPVARWDWDASTSVQYIGLRCGNAWCEIGPGKPEDPATPAFTSSSSYANAASGSLEDRVRAIKGWYDEQLLAIDSAGESRLTGLRGDVFPDTNLATLTEPMIDGQWRVVSHIALRQPETAGTLVKELEHYRVKFNLDPVPQGSSLKDMNHVLLCFGTVSSCSVPGTATVSMLQSCGKVALGNATTTKRYWTQITSKVRPSMYRCMTARSHGTVFIPSTARWRWLARDETSWRWCPAGCCEVNGDQFSPSGT